MSHKKVWDFWASRYEKLWVQKYSLSPTRRSIIETLKNKTDSIEIKTHMDVGCGIGELIFELSEELAIKSSYGLDYSPKMVALASQANPHAQINCADIMTYDPKDKFDVITCTHSLPYYEDQRKVMDKFKSMLKVEGRILIAFASANNLYDHLCMAGVKLTTGYAKYPSVHKFKEMTKHDFTMISVTLIKEKWYMPSIYLFELELKDEKSIIS